CGCGSARHEEPSVNWSWARTSVGKTTRREGRAKCTAPSREGLPDLSGRSTGPRVLYCPSGGHHGHGQGSGVVVASTGAGWFARGSTPEPGAGTIGVVTLHWRRGTVSDA